MRSPESDGSSVPVPTAPNAFSPDFLDEVQGEAEPLTASEADLAGPWKLEPLHPDLGWPGAVAVLRLWESLDKGDLPEAVFLHLESAALCAALLPLLGREPLFHLHDQPAAAAPLPGGYPLLAMFGEQGPTPRGWLRIYRPEVAAGLHLFEGLTRSPLHLATVGDAAGGMALSHVGRLLAELLAAPAQRSRDPGRRRPGRRGRNRAGLKTQSRTGRAAAPAPSVLSAEERCTPICRDAAAPPNFARSQTSLSRRNVRTQRRRTLRHPPQTPASRCNVGKLLHRRQRHQHTVRIFRCRALCAAAKLGSDAATRLCAVAKCFCSTTS
jgi:hypothetical protein